MLQEFTVWSLNITWGKHRALGGYFKELLKEGRKGGPEEQCLC